MLDPGHWAPADPKRAIAAARAMARRDSASTRRRCAARSLPATISPLDLYCYLKCRFGEPNGLAMLLKAPSVDNFIHWHYTLEAPGALIDVLGLNVRVELRFHDAPDVTDRDWRTLEVNLRGEFDRNRREMDEVKNTLERWHLFINPYRRLSLIVARYVERLNGLNLGEVAPPGPPKSEEQLKQYVEDMAACQEIHQQAMELAVCLQMMAPVLGEAAVNFLIVLLAKPEVKSDQRLLKDFTRRNIDVRIKSLSICCNGFAKSVSGSEDEFKEFLRLMDRRNDSLHGNISPSQRTGQEVFFDHGTIPLVAKHQSLSEIALANALAHVRPADALRDVETARKFVAFLLSHLEAPIRSKVQLVFEELQLGYCPKTQRVGVILPHAQVDLLLPAARPRPRLDSGVTGTE